VESFADHFNLTNYSISVYNASSIKKGIIDFSDEVNTDMIAIETHGRTGIAHLVNGSLAEDVANHIDRPVLSIRIEETEDSKKFSISNVSMKDYRNWGAE